MLSKQN